MTIDHPRFTDLPALRKIWLEAFGDTNAFWSTFLTAGFQASACRCVLQDNQPVAALYWFDCPWKGEKLAYLYAIATAKTYRGQGLCTALLEDTHALLREQGYFGAVLVPGSESLRHFYRRFGYADFGGIREQTVPASNEPLSLRQLTEEEYEHGRWQVLPHYGVELSGRMLHFFAQFAKFYAADRCVFAMTEEAGRLVVPELLGNCPDAGAIASAFGKDRVTVRTPGCDPFAMFLPLTDSRECPEYFGIALD